MEKSEAIIEKKIDCLDKGFIRLVDYMGNDESIVQAARVSYGKGTKSVRADRELIRYLMRHRHTSPFEMVEFKFHVKLPIFVARQWIRHRTANVNEHSGRYSEMEDEFYMPDIDQIRTQNQVNRQGRSDVKLPIEEAQKVTDMLDKTQKKLYEEYQTFLGQDVARELARINLPLSTYTEWYWKIDLHNLLHFLKLRLDEHAQYEIRVYATKIADIVKELLPIVFEAFEDYQLEALAFSKQELSIIKRMLKTDTLEDSLLEDFGIRGLEASEFNDKLNKLLSSEY